MKRFGIACACGLALAVAAAAPRAAAGEEEAAKQGAAERSAAKEDAAAAESEAVSAAPPIYSLPKVGKPTRRVGGGRRGVPGALPEIYVLVPDHVGLTASSQPTLYWYLSEGATGEVAFELTLIDEHSIEPIIDARFEQPEGPGLQAIRLADYDVELERGEEYQWSVALVVDPEDRSKDVVSSGWIERVGEPDDLEQRLAQAGPEGAAAVFGSEGLWYDTLAAAADLVEDTPGDERYRRQLAGLLAQVGLPEGAARP